MNVNTFKKTFREELKAENMSIRISEKNSSTIISDSKGQYCSAKYHLMYNGVANSQWKWVGSNEETFLKTVEYWEGLAKIEEKPFISFYHSHVERAKTLLESIGYKPLTAFLSGSEDMPLKMDELKRYNRPQEYVKELSPGFFKKLIIVDEKITSFLQKLEEEDPTFEGIRKSRNRTLMTILFYYKGYQGEIFLFFEKEKFVFKNKEDEILITFDENDDLESIFRKELTALEKKNRLKNLYTPAKKHFTEYVRTISLAGDSEEALYMYNTLLKRYSPEEIEVFASQNKVINYKQLDFCAVFKFLDVYFLYNYIRVPSFQSVYCFDNEEALLNMVDLIDEKELEEIEAKRKEKIKELKENLKKL